jgi:hypothetical protein
LRFIGSQLALDWTLVYVLLSLPLLVIAMPFIAGVIFPLFIGTIVLIGLSYIFAVIVRLTGGVPPSPFALACAVVYLIACTFFLG